MQRVFLLLALCFVAPAQAGLFSDDDARKQIQQLEARVLKLEAAAEQQTKSLLDLLGQIEVLNGEIRKLRGQNEELAHGLQDAEKREKIFMWIGCAPAPFEPTDNAAQTGSDAAVASDPG
jgi:TolA-binding protein